MIKLNRGNPPSELSLDKINELTREFKSTGKSVWQKKYIKDALNELSHNKCAYCECKLGEESKYMEIEHFRYKDKYEHLVVEWNNLLPSCKRCNITKSTHDVEEIPIINPCEDKPNEHMIFKAYRFYKRNNSELGKNTIDVIDLNNQQKVVIPRFLLGQAISEKLEEVLALIDMHSFNNNDVRLKNKIIKGVSTILEFSNNEQEYSGTISTIIYNDENYKEIKSKLRAVDWWNSNMENRDKHMKEVMFDIK